MSKNEYKVGATHKWKSLDQVGIRKKTRWQMRSDQVIQSDKKDTGANGENGVYGVSSTRTEKS